VVEAETGTGLVFGNASSCKSAQREPTEKPAFSNRKSGALRATRAWRAAPSGIRERRLVALGSIVRYTWFHRDEDAQAKPKAKANVRLASAGRTDGCGRMATAAARRNASNLADRSHHAAATRRHLFSARA
jgi:hypothetical protein